MKDKDSKQPTSRETTAELLHALSSVDAGVAWVLFLERYSDLIMSAACQFVYEQDKINDCFLYVCEQLNDNGFRRLLKFNTKGKARFRTWLGTVVFNLCVDWHRKEFGRATMLPAITALPAFDQSVYQLVIEQGMDKEAAYQTLRSDFPDLTREQIARAAKRVFSLLTTRQRWQISVRQHRKRPISSSSQRDSVERLPDSSSDPEARAGQQQEHEALQKALSRLPANQRLLLYLRFEEGLSLEKIAQLNRLGDANRAWRAIRAAGKSLSRHLQNQKIGVRRKN